MAWSPTPHEVLDGGGRAPPKVKAEGGPELRMPPPPGRVSLTFFGGHLRSSRGAPKQILVSRSWVSQTQPNDRLRKAKVKEQGVMWIKRASLGNIPMAPGGGQRKL